jgi:hypothetical protein
VLKYLCVGARGERLCVVLRARESEEEEGRAHYFPPGQWGPFAITTSAGNKLKKHAGHDAGKKSSEAPGKDQKHRPIGRMRLDWTEELVAKEMEIADIEGTQEKKGREKKKGIKKREIEELVRERKKKKKERKRTTTMTMVMIVPVFPWSAPV